jgi:hypothetical protein
MQQTRTTAEEEVVRSRRRCLMAAQIDAIVKPIGHLFSVIDRRDTRLQGQGLPFFGCCECKVQLRITLVYVIRFLLRSQHAGRLERGMSGVLCISEWGSPRTRSVHDRPPLVLQVARVRKH